MTDKGDTNRHWTSSEAYRESYDRLFRNVDGPIDFDMCDHCDRPTALGELTLYNSKHHNNCMLCEYCYQEMLGNPAPIANVRKGKD